MNFTKRILGIATAMVLCIPNICSVMQPLTVNAESYGEEQQYGDYLYYQTVDEDEDGTYDYVEITYCDNSATEIVIPSEIDGLSVTSIGDDVFSWCESLTSIEIPNSVTSIGDGVFSWCESLKSIEIPNSVTSIGNYAFYYCESLASIEISNSVTSIGDSAFSDCDSLENIEIPSSVTSIGDSAFSWCGSLASINVSEDNNYYSSIDGVLFNKEQTELITYPCGKGTSYTIPNSVTSIGDWAFYGCTSLESVEIPNSVTSIGNYAFHYCESLESVEIPNSVTSIGYYAFYYCESLESIEIPDGVTSIGDSAFEYCKSLASIEIPNSVTSIGDWAFHNCDSLESITIKNPDCEIYDFDYTISNGYDDNGDCYFNGTIYGYSGSTAQSYAGKYGYKFALIGDETLLGDANGDGELNVRDCAFIARLLAEGRKDELPKQADYNGDGEINVRDVSMIARYLAIKKS